jgi:hypothetical protein
MKKLFILSALMLLFSTLGFSQLLPKNNLLINKDWWTRMTKKYPGFHGTQNRWMSTGDFNKDGLPDIVLQFAAVGTSRMSWQDSLIDSRRFKAVFVNKGNNNFELDSNLVYTFKGGDDGHIVLDMNGDGFLDVYQPTDNWHGTFQTMPKYYDSRENMGEFMFINKSNKSFEESFFNETGGATRHYQVLDIDKDNDDEIAFVDLRDDFNKTIPISYPFEDSLQVFDYKGKFQRKTLQLIQRNMADSLFRNLRFIGMFSKQDTLYGLLKDPRNEFGSSSIDMFGYITATEKKAISNISIPVGLSRKPFHNNGRQGFVQDLDGDGKKEYLFSFWRNTDETTYAVIFNEQGKDISNKFFSDSLNYKIGKIKAGISDVFDDINNDGFIDIVPLHGIGFKYNNEFSYFQFNPKTKKYHVKKLHNYKIIFDSEQANLDSLAFWPDYDYKSHTAFLQYFNKRKDQDAMFTNIIAYKMNCDFLPRPKLVYSSSGLCLQNDSLSVKLNSINAGSIYSILINNKNVTFSSGSNLSFVKETGSVFVSETSIEGCVVNSDTLIVSQKTIPSTPTITTTTPLTFCSGQNVVLTSNGTNNQWYLNGNAIANATTATFTANAAGTYKVKAINGDCASPLSSASTVVVNPIPPAPTITLEANGGLTSSASDGNQWYFNDVKIDNATQKTINPTKSGNYTVKVSAPCASEVSKPYNLVVTATEETILGQVQLSPNPFTNQFKVSFPVEFGKTVQVKIVDMSGNVHFKKASVSDGEVIELGSLNGGNYVLHLNSNDNANLKTIKISKIL